MSRPAIGRPSFAMKAAKVVDIRSIMAPEVLHKLRASCGRTLDFIFVIAAGHDDR